MKKTILILTALLVIAAGCKKERHAAAAAGPLLPPYKAEFLDGKPFDIRNLVERVRECCATQ